jgi:hypothetical protein
MMFEISTVVRRITSRMEDPATDDVQDQHGRPTYNLQNQHGRPTYNLSDGRPERTKRIKQQGNTDGVPAKVPPMPLSVICRE